jgi:hypothetical protein
MSTEYSDFYGPSDMLSNCCGAVAWGEIIDGCGICSDCHEHADFDPPEDEDAEDSPRLKALKAELARMRNGE